VWKRFFLLTSLALGLALGSVSAQPRRAELGTGQGVHVQDRIDEAFRVFGNLLAVSQKAAEPGTHWRVELASWRDAQAAWDGALATLPAPDPGLTGCALPVHKARVLIEQAHALFVRVRDGAEPRALELLLEHRALHEQAGGPLREAEHCYRAAWNAYLAR